MSNIKGNGFITAHEFFLKLGGPEGMEKIRAALTEKDRETLFARPVLPISWISYTSYINFVFTASRILGKHGNLELLNDMAVYQAEKDFSGIYKIFVKIATPEFVMNKTVQLWHQYFDAGEFSVLDHTKDMVSFKLTNFPDMPLHHELEQLPYFEEVGRICGRPNTQANHPKCIARGDDHCLFNVILEK